MVIILSKYQTVRELLDVDNYGSGRISCVRITLHAEELSRAVFTALLVPAQREWDRFMPLPSISHAPSQSFLIPWVSLYLYP